jgi:hypothetical protein
MRTLRSAFLAGLAGAALLVSPVSQAVGGPADFKFSTGAPTG